MFFFSVFSQYLENYDIQNKNFSCWNHPYDKAYKSLWGSKYLDETLSELLLLKGKKLCLFVRKNLTRWAIHALGSLLFVNITHGNDRFSYKKGALPTTCTSLFGSGTDNGSNPFGITGKKWPKQACHSTSTSSVSMWSFMVLYHKILYCKDLTGLILGFMTRTI